MGNYVIGGTGAISGPPNVAYNIYRLKLDLINGGDRTFWLNNGGGNPQEAVAWNYDLVTNLPAGEWIATLFASSVDSRELANPNRKVVPPDHIPYDGQFVRVTGSLIPGCSTPAPAP